MFSGNHNILDSKKLQMHLARPWGQSSCRRAKKFYSARRWCKLPPHSLRWQFYRDRRLETTMGQSFCHVPNFLWAVSGEWWLMKFSETAQMGTTGRRHTVCLCSLYTCGNSFQVNKTSGLGRRKFNVPVEGFPILKGLHSFMYCTWWLLIWLNWWVFWSASYCLGSITWN